MKTLEPVREKLDLRKLHKDDYVTPKKPVFVDIGAAHYLTVDGRGAPSGQAFQDAIQALYSVAFTVKMTRKFAGGQDYGITQLEGQFWLDSGDLCFGEVPMDQWNWKLMIRTPDFIGKEDLKAANQKLAKKKLPSIALVRLEKLKEGRCVQMLHVGPYAEEPKTIEIMREFAAAENRRFKPVHHEIYLSDPRRVAPEKLKTILRIPVE